MDGAKLLANLTQQSVSKVKKSFSSLFIIRISHHLARIIDTSGLVRHILPGPREMASILALPNELVLHVLKFTDLADLENLSRIKLSWYRAAIPLLRLHIERKRRYSYLSGRHHLWRDVVVCVLRDPDIAYYIRHLEIDHHSAGLPYQYKLPVGSSDAKLIEESIESSLSPLVGPRLSRQACKKYITEGDESLAKQLLYTLLPKLHTLTIRSLTFHDARLLSSIVPGTANRNRSNPNDLKISALDELKYVDFHAYKEPDGSRFKITTERLGAFMALPQLSAFKLTDIRIRPPPQNAAALSVSHLTSLIFVDCAVDQDGLCPLLARVPNLRRFCFLQKESRTAVDCSLIFSTLQNHARSIQMIAFDANRKLDSSLPFDLSAFEDLRMAYIPWAFLSSTLSCSLGAAILPKLRILSILAKDSSTSDVPKLLPLFAEGWYSCPCLESVLVLDGSDETLRYALAPHGLSLIIEKHDFPMRVLGAMDEQWMAYI